MNSYIALTRMYLRLTMRDRGVLFFNYIFPMIFFFMFGQMMHAERGGATQVVNMVLTIGVLGSGLFGAGMRATMDRDANILRRFKVAPITPAPILVAALVVGVLNFLPVFVSVIFLAHWFYGMPVPGNLGQMALFVVIGLLAFRAIGLIIASVANSMQESQILIQILYMPMLLLSGATIPLTIMPVWVQIIANFLPATHLFSGMQSIVVASEGLFQNMTAVLALIVTAVIGTFIGGKLFRWEKEEKIAASAKLWVLAVLAPFVLMGVREAYSKDNVVKAKILMRDVERKIAVLVKNARILVGDGTVIESGSVLIRDGRIEQIFPGAAPEGSAVKAREVEAAGKTLLPGLIDLNVNLASPGGVFENPSDYKPEKFMPRALSAYLYSGVIEVRSSGDLDSLRKQQAKLQSGERLGPELYLSGPVFTTEGGGGTEFVKAVPESLRKSLSDQLLRLPKSPDEARRFVQELKSQGADSIRAVYNSGDPGRPLNRMDRSILVAIGEEAKAQKIPLVVVAGSAQDVTEALDAHPSMIEDDSVIAELPPALFARLKQEGVAFEVSLVALEDLMALASGKNDPFERSLVQQVGPPELLRGSKKMLSAGGHPPVTFGLDVIYGNLKRASETGVTLVTGTNSGSPLTFHGPAIHRELQLWVLAGVPSKVALQAATYNSAMQLGAGNRIGLIKKGYEASMVLVDGNPLADVSATERISALWFKGEHVDRSELFEEKNN